MATNTPPIPYTARTYDLALSAILQLVQQTNGATISDFTESNAGTMLMSLAAAVIDVASYGQDFAMQEAFLSTCRTAEAALRFARSVAYVPRAATPAVATLVCSPLPTQVQSLGGTVAAGQTVTVGSVAYTLFAAVTIPAGATVAAFTLSQAIAASDTFATTSQAYQAVRTNGGDVAQDSWAIFVGDPGNPANEWAQVDDTGLLTSASNSYQVSFDADGKMTVTFGNGSQGAIPGDAITVNYWTTSGSAGNVPVYGVAGSLLCATSGGTASLTVSNTTGPAAGGDDAESLSELKRNIPAYIKSNNRVVTLEDYENAVITQPGIALSYADISIASYEANVVKCFPWAYANVTFTAESTNQLLSSAVPYRQYAQISPQAANAIHDALTPRTMLTVEARVLQPGVAWADIYVGNVRYDPRYVAATLHQNIADAVVGVFEAGDGFTVSIPDITDAIRGVDGVRRFNVQRIVFDQPLGGYATGTVTFTGNPYDGDTVSIHDGRVGYAYEFDSNTSTLSGNVRVVIGNSAETTATNLINAVNQTLAIRAYRDPVATGPTVALVQSRVGDAYDIPIITAGHFPPVITVAGMSGGTYAVGTVRQDRRLDQSPIPDPYPIGAYTVGSPGTNWATGGIAPYLAMKDLDISHRKTARNRYDNQYTFNNEILYDSGIELQSDIAAINLRRLVVDLVPDTRTGT